MRWVRFRTPLPSGEIKEIFRKWFVWSGIKCPGNLHQPHVQSQCRKYSLAKVDWPDRYLTGFFGNQ